MKTIKVFLASSEELDYDRVVFGNLIRRLDDLYEKRGIRIKLFEWEDYDAAYNDQRKQEEYNEKVRESDVFLALFHKKAGKFTIEEFNVATEQFKEKASPKVFAFCKDLKPDEKESEELAEFKKRLFEEMGHYWCRYDSRESLQFQFVMQLQLVESGQFNDLKVEERDVTLCGIRIAPLDKLRFAADNEDYVKMCQELSSWPEKIEKARLLLERYPNDIDLADDLQQKMDQYYKLRDEVEKYQQLLVNTAKRIAQLQDVHITDRMRRAMDAFCEGKVREANIILDEAEKDARSSLNAYRQYKEVTEQKRQSVLNSIEELRLKAGIVMSDASCSIDERVEQTKQIFFLADEMAQTVDYEKAKFEVLLQDYGEFLYCFGFYNDAITIYQRLMALARELGDFDKLFVSYNAMGLAYADMGLYLASFSCYRQAINIYPSRYDVCNNIGLTYYWLGKYQEALKFLEKALSNYGTSKELKARDVANTLNNIGLVYNSLNNLDKAKDNYLLALELREKDLGLDHPDVAQSYNNLGLLFEAQKEYDKALEYHLHALEIRKKTLGVSHPDTIDSYRGVGSMYIFLGQAEEALSYLQKALDIGEKKLGTEHPKVAETNSLIGYAYNDLGRHKEALPYHKRAVEIIEKTPDWNSPFVANIYSFAGWTYECLNNYPNALECYQKMLKFCESIYGIDHEFTKTATQRIEKVKKIDGR